MQGATTEESASGYETEPHREATNTRDRYARPIWRNKASDRTRRELARKGRPRGRPSGRAGPCGRLRRCFATCPSKQSFFGAF